MFCYFPICALSSEALILSGYKKAQQVLGFFMSGLQAYFKLA